MLLSSLSLFFCLILFYSLSFWFPCISSLTVGSFVSFSTFCPLFLSALFLSLLFPSLRQPLLRTFSPFFFLYVCLFPCLQLSSCLFSFLLFSSFPSHLFSSSFIFCSLPFPLSLAVFSSFLCFLLFSSVHFFSSPFVLVSFIFSCLFFFFCSLFVLFPRFSSFVLLVFYPFSFPIVSVTQLSIVFHSVSIVFSSQRVCAPSPLGARISLWRQQGFPSVGS